MALLQKYFEQGWLKYGDAYITQEDRLNVGNRFYGDFYKAGIVDLRIPDYSKPRVDGGNSKGVSEFVLDARERFNKAFLSLTPEQSYILWQIICLDKPIKLEWEKSDYRHNIEVLKEEICKSLDALYFHYYGKQKGKGYHKITSWLDQKSKEAFSEWREKMVG